MRNFHKEQPQDAADYPNTWEGVEAAAKACGTRWPQLVAAQWALESARGTATSGKHNYFGLKGSGSGHVTQEEVNGQMVTITAEFIDFPSLKACVEYLVARWYLDYKGYKGVDHAASAEAAAHALKDQGYCTDSGYPDKLIKLMGQHGQPSAAAPAQQQTIAVPYFNQLLMDDGQGWRDCFSTTCAMIAAWKGKVASDTSGENAYNHVRQKHGDSTIASSQVAALADLGLTANYGTNGTKAKLIDLLDRGIPVGTGILHHGMASSPSGGGHWMLIVGHDSNGVIALDPYGELNVVNGTWARQGSGGDHVHYSWKNWLPRWEVAGGDGYLLWVDR